MRFNKHELGQWTLIDDTYNANPLSAARMLESAGELAEDKDFILVFGEMKELGDLAEQEHEEFGKLAAQKILLRYFSKAASPQPCKKAWRSTITQEYSARLKIRKSSWKK